MHFVLGLLVIDLDTIERTRRNIYRNLMVYLPKSPPFISIYPSGDEGENDDRYIFQ